MLGEGGGFDEQATLDPAWLAAVVQDPEGPWVDGVPAERLVEVGDRLEELSHRLVDDGRGQDALGAAVAATRAYRTLVEGGTTDDYPALVMRHTTALTGVTNLLAANGRADEIPRVIETLGLGTDWMARVAERVELQSTIVEQQLERANDRFGFEERLADLQVTITAARSQGPRRAELIRLRLAAVPGPVDPVDPADDAALAGTGPFRQVQAATAREFLLARTGTDDPEQADRLVGALGGLAPALELAVRYIVEVDGMSLAGFLDRFAESGPKLWELGLPAGCPEPVARACLLGLEHVAAASAAGMELIELCSRLEGDADAPLDWLLAADKLLPPALRTVAASGRGLDEAIGLPVRLGLLGRTGAAVRVDPLVRTVADLWLGERGRERTEQAAALVLAAWPAIDREGSRPPADEPLAAMLLPHLSRLATALGGDAHPATLALLQEIAAYHLWSRTFHEAEDATQRAIAMVEPDSPHLHHLFDRLARIRRELGDETGQRQALERSLALKESTFGGYSLGFAHELRRHAEALVGLGDHEAARAALERAAQIMDGAPDVALDVRLDVLDRLGAVLRESGDRPAATAVLQRAIAARERAYGLQDPELLDSLVPLARALQEQGDPADAAKVWERALEIHGTCFNPGLPKEWIGTGLLAALTEVGDPAALRAGVQRLLDLYVPQLSHANLALLEIVDRWAGVLESQNDLAGARAALERIVARTEEPAFGPVHRLVFDTFGRLADVQRRQGDPAAAATTLARLVAYKQRRYGEKNMELVGDLLDLGDAKAEAGDLAGALPVLQRAMTIIRGTHGDDHPKTATAAIDIALIVHRSGDLERARTLLDMAVTFAERAYGDDHQETARALEALADVLSGLGETEAAESCLARISPAGKAPAPPPVAMPERLTVADLDRFEPGWTARVRDEELPDIARRLADLAEGLADQPEQELRALSAAIAAQTVVVEHMSDEELGTGTGAQLLGALLARKQHLLVVTGRIEELAQAGQEVEALQRRLDAFWRRLEEERTRRAEELDRRMAPLDRRAEVGHLVVEQRRRSERRLGEVARRMASSVPGAPGETGNFPPPEVRRPAGGALAARITAALEADRVVTVVGDPRLDAGPLARSTSADLAWWIDAGTQLTMLHDLSRLAERLAVGADQRHLPATAEAVIDELGRRTGWLLVFGNAVSSDLLQRLAQIDTGRALIIAGDATEPLPGRTWIEAERPVDGGRVDDAGPDVDLAKLAAASPAALELLRLCAVLDTTTELPLDRLVAAPELLPAALRAAAESDPGLGEPLGTLGRLGLMARDGTAGWLPPAVAEAALSTSLSTSGGEDDEDGEDWWERAAMIVLTAFPTLSEETDALAAAARLAPHALKLAEGATDRDPVLVIELLDLAGSYLAYRGEDRAAVVPLRRAQELRDRTYPSDDPESGRALHRLFEVMCAAGDAAAARALLERRLPTEPDGGPFSAEHADALRTMAELLRGRGDREAERSVLERELVVRERVDGPDSAEVAGLLRQLAHLHRLDRRYGEARAALDRALLITETLHGPQSLQVWHVLCDLTGVLRDEGDAEAERSVLERRLAILEHLEGPDSLGAVSDLERLADVMVRLGDREGARAALTRVVTGKERLGQPSTAALRHLAKLLLRTGDATAAQATYEQLIATRRQLGGPADGRALELLRELVTIARSVGDLATARSGQERLLQALETAHGPDARQVAVALGELAALQHELGDHQGSRASLERAVAIDESAGDHARARLAEDLSLLGEQLSHLLDLPSARATLERAVATTEAAYGAEHIEVGRVLGKLAQANHDMEDFPAARQAWERTLAIHQRLLGDDHPDTLRVLNGLGGTLRALGDPAGARALHERALRGFTQAFVPDRGSIGRTLSLVSEALQDLGDLLPARKALEWAVALAEEEHGYDHPAVARVLRHLAEVLRGLGDLPAAEAATERATLIETGTRTPNLPPKSGL